MAKGDNVLVPNADADTVRRIYRDYLAGHSSNQITRACGCAENLVLRLLHSPVYYGRMVYAGVNAQGKHEPLVSEADWRAVQARLPHKVTAPRPARQQYAYLLTGMIRCDCGAAMSPGGARGAGGRYYYYRCSDSRCTVKGRLVRADQLDAAVLRAIADKAGDPAEIGANYRRIVGALSEQRRAADGSVKPLERELAGL
jgi:site-specific DNA recombinase